MSKESAHKYSAMNEYEITSYQPRTTATEHGIHVLRAFVELINNISDGWAHWPYGTQCSRDLQDLLQERKDVATVDQIRRAVAKILRFLERSKRTKQHPKVQEFLAYYRTSGKAAAVAPSPQPAETVPAPMPGTRMPWPPPT